jgi:hypothetical protein
MDCKDRWMPVKDNKEEPEKGTGRNVPGRCVLILNSLQIFWVDVLVLFGFFILLRLIGYFVLKFKLHMDR